MTHHLSHSIVSGFGWGLGRQAAHSVPAFFALVIVIVALALCSGRRR